MKANNIYKVIAGVGIILLVPLTAMLLTEEVQWNWFDFAIVGTLLMSAGIFFEFVSSKLNTKYRPAAAVIIISAVLLIWAELAVGIFGSPFAGN